VFRKKEEKKSMEVGSTIVKTFKRFTIPRSASSIGSFTTSNGTATSAEQHLEEIPSSKPTSSSHHKHPPLSYVQHFRSHHSQQNLTSIPSQQQHLPTRPLSDDISSFMIRSTSTNFTPKKNRVINLKIDSLKYFVFFVLDGF
jgi:hypothetical protein